MGQYKLSTYIYQPLPQRLPVKKVYFVYNIKTLELSEGFLEEARSLTSKVDSKDSSLTHFAFHFD